MKLTMFIFLAIAAVGCSSQPNRMVASTEESFIEGSAATALMDHMRSQVKENCDGAVCSSQAEAVSCFIERTIPDAACSWKAIKPNGKNKESAKLPAKYSNKLYDFLKKYEVCDGASCSIELVSVSCSIERSMPDAGCRVLKSSKN